MTLRSMGQLISGVTSRSFLSLIFSSFFNLSLNLFSFFLALIILLDLRVLIFLVFLRTIVILLPLLVNQKEDTLIHSGECVAEEDSG